MTTVIVDEDNITVVETAKQGPSGPAGPPGSSVTLDASGEANYADSSVAKESECAEYALTIWHEAGMPPTDKATPAACADGALQTWGASITAVQNGGRK